MLLVVEWIGLDWIGLAPAFCNNVCRLGCGLLVQVQYSMVDLGRSGLGGKEEKRGQHQQSCGALATHLIGVVGGNEREHVV
jgi:hypothetical protein